MKDRLFALFAYFKYWLRKEDEYSLQGPFLSDLYSGLKDHLKSPTKTDLGIEEFRNSLLNNHHKIEVLDLGAGSKRVNTKKRKISDITAYSTSGRKFCQIYQYFCSLTPAKNIIELGTCMGISTRYLASSAKTQVISIEGSEEIRRTAMKDADTYPIEFVLGEIKEVLPGILQEIDSIDFALIDANHTYEGTMENYGMVRPFTHPKTILVIADIHWSKGMERAWNEIRNQPEIKLSIDLYEAGILFFDAPFEKAEHLVLSI